MESFRERIRVWRVRNRINSLYKKLLNRTADPEGLQFFTRQILDGEYDYARIEAIIQNSDEYYRVRDLEPPEQAVNPAVRLRRLNLGCGFDRRPDCINIDIKFSHAPDIVADARTLAMFRDGFATEIIAQDLLEHLYRHETGSVLKEWNRVLTLGGTLYLRVPNVIGLLDLLKSKEKESVGEQMKLIQALFGSQVDSGDFHHTGFTDKLLRHYLIEAGFVNLNIRVKDCWMMDVTARKMSLPVHSP
ncbi:methyltransferase domain-containing protein [bacterium]|nr:methyltransferase domain-containing protein [candidate division CSSED10-310 bacterium]